MGKHTHHRSFLAVCGAFVCIGRIRCPMLVGILLAGLVVGYARLHIRTNLNTHSVFIMLPSSHTM